MSCIAYRTLRCTGFRPSLASGRARETITLIAYERKESFISSSMEWGRMFPEKVSSIQVFHLSGILLDKGFARFDLVAHKRREQLVGYRRRLDRDLEQRPVLRVHGRLPELDRVHLPEALEATDVGVAVGVQACQGLLQLALVVDVVVLALVRDLEQRRLGDVHVAGFDQLGHVPEKERKDQRADVA